MKIIIWTGGAWEKWSPMSAVVDGLGGSEIAAINVAEQLAARGHDIEVWGRVLDGNFNGVRYRQPLGTDRPECDVFVSSREVEAVAEQASRARLRVLWMHDLYSGEDWNSSMTAYDLILSVSEWARRQHVKSYRHVSSERFVATRNGIDPRRFLREGEHPSQPRPVGKAGCRVIYASSPDRGLSRLLDLWPRIREILPEAELDVCYGFANWYAAADREGDRDLILSINYLRHRLDTMRWQGVCYRGRVGQAELASYFMGARLWLYPTRFLETSCITAMEAQAAGCYPIVTDAGALPETVRCGSFVYDKLEDDAFDRKFLGFVQHFAEDPGWVEGVTHMNRQLALQNLSWSGVALQWEKLFAERLGRTS
jgi:glycosyltransferase involved in cell wall biosynthesis